ncbi:MAG: hypothetical protein ACD_68C00108G0002 [uncultured bacterium]|nr:MAG: hypothetical protein ACD_68C00108G0002 [uncultured bacterium]
MARFILILIFLLLWYSQFLLAPQISFLPPLNLFLAGLITLNILQEYRRALFYSLWFGLFSDIATGQIIGLTSLSWLTTSLIIYLFITNIISNRERYSKIGLYVLALVVAKLTLIIAVWLLSYLQLANAPSIFSLSFLWAYIWEVAFSLLVFPLIYKLLKRSQEFANNKTSTLSA